VIAETDTFVTLSRGASISTVDMRNCSDYS